MEKDKDGYYHVTLGMFDKNISPEVFGGFKKRCLAGQVHAELGGPKLHPLASAKAVLDRMYEIDETNVCAQILDVEMSEDGKRLIGNVKPSGPHGHLLKKMMEGEDCVFSMRSVHEVRTPDRPTEIITYNLVSKG